MPVTRNYVMKSRTQQINPANGNPIDWVVANGILAGQFLLPNFEYIFPENHTIGDPLIPYNFQDMPFLAQGSGPVDGYGNTSSAIVGQLDPWPGSTTPTPANCVTGGAAPSVNAGQDISATTGTSVHLGGTVTWDANSVSASRTLQWAQTAGAAVGTIAQANTLTPSFTAPAEGTFTFTLTATDNIGTTSDSVNVNVVPSGDTVSVTAATWNVQIGKKSSFGKLAVTATSTDAAAILTLSELGTDGNVYNWGTGAVTNTPLTYQWIELKGAPQPATLTVSSSKGGSKTVTCGAANLNGVISCQ